MKAVVWNGPGDVRVENVADPTIRQPTDAIVRVTSTGLCGSDLHLYSVLAPFMEPGDVLGHEPMGIVEAVGSETAGLAVGDRVVVPFNVSCGRCHMCVGGLQSQCETTQNHEHGTGGSLLGYTKLYGHLPGGQAELLRVPHADYGPIVVPDGPGDDRYLLLSDVLPTAWQAVEYADVGPGDSLVVLGLGPIGDMCARIARFRGIETVIGADLVPERLARVRSRGIDVIDIEAFDSDDDLADHVRERTDGRGPDAVIDAVGMEAHGSPVAHAAHKVTAMAPKRLAERLMMKAGVDRLAALETAIRLVRRGGTISVIGVYGGMANPLPMLSLFDKQITLRMGQANVRNWVDDLLPLLDDDDPLGVDEFVTHHLPLDDAPHAYDAFQTKSDGMIKAVFRP